MSFSIGGKNLIKVISLGLFLPLLGSSPLSLARQCSLRGLVNALKKHDLIPYQLGSERQAIEEVLALTQELPQLAGTLEEAIAIFPTKLPEGQWSKIGSEKYFGTHLPNPEDLEGQVITALIKLSGGPPHYKIISGKVIRVPIKATGATTQEKDIQISIQGPEGKELYNFLDLYQTFQLKRVSSSKKQRVAQSVKTKIERTGHNLADYARELKQKPRRFFIFPETHEEPLLWRGLLTERQFKFHPLKTPLYFATHPHEFFFWFSSWAKHVDMEFHHTQGNISDEQYAEFLAKNFPGTYKTLTPLKFLSEHTYKPVSRLVARAINTTFNLAHPHGNIEGNIVLSGPLNFVLGAYAFSLAYNQYLKFDEHLLDQKRVELIRKHQHAFLQNVTNDPFLERVHHQLSQGKISAYQAAEEAYIRYTAADAFLFLMQQQDHDNPAETQAQVLSDKVIKAIFPATLAAADKGPASFPQSSAAPTQLWEQAGTLTVPSAQQNPATDAQLERHIAINYQFFIKRQLIFELVNPTLDLNYLAHIPVYRDQLTQWFFVDPNPNTYDHLLGQYIQALLHLHAAGQVSKDNLQYALLEALQFEEKFLRWQVFAAERSLNSQVLSLKDFLKLRLLCLDRSCPEIAVLSSLDYYNFNEYYFPSLSDLNQANLGQSHILARIRKIVNKIKKGRYKKAAKGQGFKKAHILSQSGELISHRQGLGSGAKFMSGLGNFFIALDVSLRFLERQALTTQVADAGKQTLAKHHNLSYLKITPHNKNFAIKLFNFLQQLKAPPPAANATSDNPHPPNNNVFLNQYFLSK